MRGVHILSANRDAYKPSYVVSCSAMKGDKSDKSFSDDEVLETSYEDDMCFGLTMIEEGILERRRWFQPIRSERDLNARIRGVLDSSSLNQKLNNIAQLHNMG